MKSLIIHDKNTIFCIWLDTKSILSIVNNRLVYKVTQCAFNLKNQRVKWRTFDIDNYFGRFWTEE